MAAITIKVPGFFDVSEREGEDFSNDFVGDDYKLIPCNSVMFLVDGDYEVTDPQGVARVLTFSAGMTAVFPAINVKTSAGLTLAAGIAIATYQPGYYY